VKLENVSFDCLVKKLKESLQPMHLQEKEKKQSLVGRSKTMDSCKKEIYM